MKAERKTHRSRVIGIATALAAIALLSSCSTTSLINRTLARSQKEREKAYAYYLDKSEIKVVLVGTAGPMSPDLAQNSTAVFVNGKFFLFDAGDYAQKRMEQFNLPVPEIDAVFLTHFHNDHIANVGEVMQRSFIMGRAKDLYIYGPTGTEQLVNGFMDAYELDSHHRTDHHGEELMPSAFSFATPVEFDQDENDVARLALTHYAPSAPSRMQLRRVYMNPIKAEYDGQIIAGSDGTTVVIPLE